MMDKCQVCGKLEDERNTQEQCGVTLCVGCDGLYTDEELCCLCLNKFNVKDLTVMPDGGSGGVCTECVEKT